MTFAEYVKSSCHAHNIIATELRSKHKCFNLLIKEFFLKEQFFTLSIYKCRNDIEL